MDRRRYWSLLARVESVCVDEGGMSRTYDPNGRACGPWMSGGGECPWVVPSRPCCERSCCPWWYERLVVCWCWSLLLVMKVEVEEQAWWKAEDIIDPLELGPAALQLSAAETAAACDRRGEKSEAESSAITIQRRMRTEGHGIAGFFDQGGVRTCSRCTGNEPMAAGGRSTRGAVWQWRRGSRRHGDGRCTRR